MRKAYIESFIILLFLSCCPFIVSSCHEEEKEEIPESPFDEEDIQHEQDLNAYLGKSYSCLKSASNLNGNLNCSKELEHYAS